MANICNIPDLLSRQESTEKVIRSGANTKLFSHARQPTIWFRQEKPVAQSDGSRTYMIEIPIAARLPSDNESMAVSYLTHELDTALKKLQRGDVRNMRFCAPFLAFRVIIEISDEAALREIVEPVLARFPFMQTGFEIVCQDVKGGE